MAHFAAALIALGSTTGALAGEVQVNFIHADRFSDMGEDLYSPADTMKVLAANLRRLGHRYLPADQTLRVDILDIDLAGQDEWWHRTVSPVRVLRSVTWPRIHLRYALERDGKPLQSGDETVADLSYLDHVNRYVGDDPYRYEKQMLDEWFRRRFPAAAVQP